MKADKMQELSDLLECENDYSNTIKYKDYLIKNRYETAEIQDFINSIIKKYSTKTEVINFYTGLSSNSNYTSQYANLCIIEKMLLQYRDIKILKDIKEECNN